MSMARLGSLLRRRVRRDLDNNWAYNAAHVYAS
jgi:hypothetical protein